MDHDFFSEGKKEPRSQKKVIAKEAIIYRTPDVKSENQLPEAQFANPFPIKKPGTRYLSCPALPTIAEDKEGEEHLAEIETLTAKLSKAKYELQQQTQTACLSLGHGDKHNGDTHNI